MASTSLATNGNDLAETYAREKAKVGTKAKGDFTNDERVDYNRAYADYVIAFPDLFNQGQIAAANKILGLSVENLYTQEYTAGDAIYDFASDVSDTAATLGNAVVSVTDKLAIIAVAGLVLYFMMRKE